jgi:hypothetical protein
VILVYPHGTIVRIKRTGQFDQIIRVCWCQGHWAPLHYEAWIFDKGEKGNATLTFIFQRDTKLERLPYEPTPEEIKQSIDTLAEIIVNRLLTDFEEQSKGTKF